MTIKAKKSKINLREKLAELLNFRQIRDRLDGLGLYLGKDRTGTAENLAVRGGANVDDLQLAEISAALGDTAVDVFVYDTRKDSDGGKWRERTSHTSWYNEELNTATRGSRREFPAVAVIVAESDKVTIYDGDDPDLNMWMVFNGSGGRMIWATQLSCVSSLNARLSIGSPASGFRYIDFVSDKMREWRTSGVNSISGDISERNSGNLTLIDIPGQDVIVNQIINDVAMTVLPNAPIDDDTGLPVPTIAVATDGGVSVIKDDGSMVDITCGQASFEYSYYVIFDQLNRLFFSFDGQGNSRRIWGLSNIPTGDLVVTTNINEKQSGDIFIADDNGYGTATKDMFLFNQSNPHAIGLTSDNSIGTDKGLFKAFINKQDSSKSLYNYITSKYNTGWMPGDIKLATLSDTKIETVGVDESTELITNGDFSTDVTGWSFTSGASISHDTTEYTGGALQINQNSSSGQGAYQSINTIIGQSYVLNVIGKGDSIGNLSNLVVEIGTSIMGSELGGSIVGSGAVEGNVSITFVASSTITYISLGPTGSDTRVAYVNNISVRATTELITNGDFSNGITGWVGVGATISIDTQRLKVEVPANTWGAGSQTITGLIVGKTYVLTATITNGTGQGKIDNSGQGVASSYFTGTQAFTFTCTNSSMTIRLYAENKSTSNYAYFDNISVRPAEEDRSVNGNGLQIFGEIQKTPVAPGADLVAYSGFSANNYLVQPYNEDLNFGAGDFCFLFWVKAPTSSEHETIFEGGYDYSLSAYSDNCFHFFITDSGPIAFSISNTGFQSLDQFICLRNIRNNTWSQVAVRRVGDIFEYYINGQFDSSHTFINSDGIIDFQNSKLTVGCRANNLLPMDNSSLSSLRISATAPTAEQIAKIYRDEKVLFTDGAQATLYGTSDAVTALAYDEKTELLHVGTSSGRSDFSGLRRINNTTTAITTSISAHNNLIAEQ